MDEREELKCIDRFSSLLELRLQRVGQREIHVVAAEKNVLADADALDLKVAVLAGDRDQAEVRRASADVAHEHDVARADLLAPVAARLRGPCVKCRLRFLEQHDFSEARGLGRVGGQRARDFIERRRHREHDLARGEIPFAALRALGVEKALAQVFEVAPRTVERGEPRLLDVRFPWQHGLLRIGVKVRQPRFRRRDEAVRHERAMLAREMADDGRVRFRRPRQPHGVLRKLVRMRHVERRGQRRFFTRLIRAEHLRDLDDLRATALKLLDGRRAVARAEVNAEAELRLHFSSTSAGAMPGSRRASVLMIRGNFTNSVFQPLWMSVPVNGGSPLIFPSSRYSSGA